MRKWIAAAICVITSCQALAFTTRPVDGLWSMDNELNLAIGRAFNLEVSGSYLIVSFYNYTAQGAPTFHVTAGLLDANNRMTAGLSEPQGGTCLGCQPTSGSVRSSPGNVTFEFTSSTKGFVTLPGEARKAISKGAITWPAAPAGLGGLWAFAYIGSGSNPVGLGDVATLSVRLQGTTTGSGLLASTNGKYGCEQQISGSLAGQVICLMLGSSASFDKVTVGTWWGDRMDGLWQYRNINSFNLFTANRLLSAAADQVILKTTEEPDHAMQRRLQRTLEEYVATVNSTP